jgi:sugar lactone lactonase YvrE
MHLVLPVTGAVTLDAAHLLQISFVGDLARPMLGSRFMKMPLTVALVSVFGLLACPPPPGACSTTGTGSIAVTFSGLPAGIDGKLTLMGPSSQTLTMGQTVTVSAGNWAVVSERVTVTDPIVRTVYAARVSAPNFCLVKDATQAVQVTWTKVATSNRLWVGNGSGGMGSTHAFDAASLGATGTVASSWNGNLAASAATAFDKDGNLWALGNTTVDPLVGRFPATGFAMATAPALDRRIEVPSVDCFPRASAIAFDKNGNLFVASSCKREVYKLPASSLEGSGSVTPSLTLTGFMGLSGLAFDKDGNLWVSDSSSDQVLRYDAASLDGASAMPTRRVSVRKSDQPNDMSALKPDALAFDKDGKLWSYDFGANVVFAVSAADLSGTGLSLATPLVRISISVSAVLEGLAFDEGGGLWLPYSAGKLARLAPAQLTVSTGSGAPTVPDTIITGSSLGSVQGPAFYPAAKGTPLFHALP